MMPRIPRRTSKIVGAAIAGLAVLASILELLSLPPREWEQLMESWGATLFATVEVPQILVFSLMVLTGVAVYASVQLFRITTSSTRLVTHTQFMSMLDDSLETGRYTHMKIFSYTHETFKNFFPFDERYRENNIQILSRSWLAEKIDEEQHNSNIRPC